MCLMELRLERVVRVFNVRGKVFGCFASVRTFGRLFFFRCWLVFVLGWSFRVDVGSLCYGVGFLIVRIFVKRVVDFEYDILKVF